MLHRDVTPNLYRLQRRAAALIKYVRLAEKYTDDSLTGTLKNYDPGHSIVHPVVTVRIMGVVGNPRKNIISSSEIEGYSADLEMLQKLPLLKALVVISVLYQEKKRFDYRIVDA